MPFFVSNNSRYIYSEKSFTFSVKDKQITLSSDFKKLEVIKVGDTLKSIKQRQKIFPKVKRKAI